MSSYARNRNGVTEEKGGKGLDSNLQYECNSDFHAICGQQGAGTAISLQLNPGPGSSLLREFAAVQDFSSMR